MSNPYPMVPGGQGASGSDGPPGQDLLSICLALLAAVIGTPYLFEFVGPFVADLTRNAYGSDDFADLMYFVSFALTGVVIYSVCRIVLWYAIGAIITFSTIRWGHLLSPLPGF
ncbi:MAG: hypothetical protein ACPGOY_11545 [Rhodospirillaceae bacterium]